MGLHLHSVSSCLVLTVAGALHQQRESPGTAVVTKNQPISETSTLGPDTPKSIRRLMGSHSAYTSCAYDLRWSAASSLQSQKPSGDDVEATIVITTMNSTLSLKTTMYLPEEASRRICDHEDGHRLIGERVYETADDHAKRLAQSKIGKAFSGKGSTLDLAQEAALNSAGNELIAEYLAAVRDEGQLVHGIYDEITDHGVNARLREDEAIRVAFETRKKQKKAESEKRGGRQERTPEPPVLTPPSTASPAALPSSTRFPYTIAGWLRRSTQRIRWSSMTWI